MARKVFYSFHYQPDNWRAAQIRNMGVLEGNTPVSDNDWESVTRGGDQAIRNWITVQMNGRSCAVVLVGAATAGRKWIKYEITKAWEDGKGIVGVNVHGLLNASQQQATKGRNPFDDFSLGADKKPLSSIVKLYDPPYTNSKNVYGYICDNLSDWVEEAVKIRNQY